MKKFLFSFLIIYINAYKLYNVNSFTELLISFIMSFLGLILILIIWNIIPVCKLTKNHVPELKNGIYYCKYCKHPIKKL